MGGHSGTQNEIKSGLIDSGGFGRGNNPVIRYRLSGLDLQQQ
jgi:hypothetical protein